MFCHLWPNFENSKWPPFLGRGKFFENCRVHSLDTLWVENFDEIALSRTVKEIEANLARFTKSNPIQAINPMNLHTKFQKARLNSIL